MFIAVPTIHARGYFVNQNVHILPDWLPGRHRPGSCHPGRLETEVFEYEQMQSNNFKINYFASTHVAHTSNIQSTK
jgi:hypothetical protein